MRYIFFYKNPRHPVKGGGGLLNRLLEKGGINRVGFHCLRHTFASRLVASGCDVKTVSALLGHLSVRTTLDWYVHPDMEQKRKAVNRLEKKAIRNLRLRISYMSS